MIIVNPIVPPESANNNSKPNPNWKKKDDSADSLSYLFESDLYGKMKELGSEDPLADIKRYQNRNK